MLEEQDLLAVEDEWEADHEDDPDYMVDEEVNIEDLRLNSESDDDNDSGDDDYEDMPLSDNELEDVSAEAEEHARCDDGPADADGGNLKRVEFRDLPAVCQRVYDIYKRNGWPYEVFDVQRCRSELFDLQAEEQSRRARAKLSASRPSMMREDCPSMTREEWCEERRQLMKQKVLAEGKVWDEAKEMSRSAEEWWEEYRHEIRQRQVE
ncbi:unnamed protein product [Zymoseptoria tritici ST99CH_3D1]|uniref:Uncharacterized protein n=1 Tax=Zymoseptoria tritici ST99CH_1E4 TaxID=1276532 RepID=A0A2H1GPF6_ZYMTR|nr:unnamed protein product [Zymoseptoria tritici ST99CH_1E4]SMR57787.1 unnamed protein product [Zymoseptoria tritici ST99CH_3D1]